MPSKKNRNWIFIRGLAREARHWGLFLEQFKEVFPEDVVQTVDLPGAGKSKSAKMPKSMSQLVDFLRSQVQLDGKNDNYLFSVSLGGMAAIQWASMYESEIKKLVVLNTSSSLSPFYRRLRWEVWKEFLTAVAKPNVKEREKSILKIVANSEENRNRYEPIWIKLGHEHTVSIPVALKQLKIASAFNPPQDTTLKNKSLFLVGLGDRLVEPECSIVVSKHLSAPLECHPWGGHDLTIDDPDWVIERVSDWLSLENRHEA